MFMFLAGKTDKTLKEAEVIEGEQKMEVLEEGEIFFDPEEFLANLIPPLPPKDTLILPGMIAPTQPLRTPLPPPPQTRTEPPPQTRTEITHHCPIHYLSPMVKGKVNTLSGEWEFLRCSEDRYFNKCFVTCGADRVEQYLESVKSQVHTYYKNPNKNGMICFCGRSVVLVVSNSENNKDRLYFRCPKRQCKFFQWADVLPYGKAKECLQKSKNTVHNQAHPHPVKLDPSIPFDIDLWNECQKVPIWVADSYEHANRIGAPREIVGHYLTAEKEPRLRKQVYTLRAIANNKKRE